MLESEDFQTLYQQFDRLIDLPLLEQRPALDALKKSGDRLALQLEGVFAVVRPWIPGQSLEQCLAARDALSFDEILFIGQGIVSGFRTIHEEGRWKKFGPIAMTTKTFLRGEA